MKRFQARAGGGRFTRNTFENVLGMHAGHCSSCGSLNPSKVGEPRPAACDHCGSSLDVCAHGRCTEQFPDPAVVIRGGYEECGAPAVACDVEHRWPVCAAHADEPR